MPPSSPLSSAGRLRASNAAAPARSANVSGPGTAPLPAMTGDAVERRDLRDAGQGSAAYAAASLGHNAAVRADYHRDVANVASAPGAERSDLRKQIRERAQDRSTPLARALAKEAAKSPERRAKLAGKTPERLAESASHSNAGFDSLGRAAKYGSRGLAALGAAGAAYDIATAPAGERPRVAVENAGAMLGGISGGAACEAIAVAIGLPEAGIGAIVTGALGALMSSAIGGDAGSSLADRVLERSHAADGVRSDG